MKTLLDKHVQKKQFWKQKKTYETKKTIMTYIKKHFWQQSRKKTLMEEKTLLKTQ